MNDATQSKTLVLVVGAGASKEVNLPVGAELRTKIASALDIRYDDGYRRSSGDSAIDDAYRVLASRADAHRADINSFLHSSWRIRDAMPQAISIDNFIDSHRNDGLIAICGKLAIARCILAAEAESALFVNRRDPNVRINFAGVEGTWFNAFFQLLTENCQETEIDQRLAQVAIVSFNYDRCIAHYLHGALQNYYGITSERAAQAMSNLQIFHPYGSVGQLPWQGQRDGVDYGSNPGGQNLVRISEGIRTFTEGIDPDHSSVVEIRRTLENAQRIAFLGFAFHRLNLQLLFPGLADGQQVKNRPTYATGHGISNADGQEIRNELSALGAVFQERFYFRNDLTCDKLFREFWRSLSLQP
jgi:hypothetical protein